jgi:hypothetical protein
MALCETCGERPRKHHRRTCGRCTMLAEHRDPEHERARRTDYKRRVRRMQGAATRDERARRRAAAITEGLLRSLERQVVQALTRRAAPCTHSKRPNKGARARYEAKRRHTLQRRARRALYEAIRKGLVVKPSTCARCGAEPPPRELHGHHSDYSKPLDVEWLCHYCHRGPRGEHGRRLGSFQSHF